ncbi:plasmid recombination protein, partial [Aminobacter sp. J41]|uniref:plasmid recombination protein n=1 Tax=Aminobacter sp. J41 TaxID=935261 RepID=UPI000552B047
MAQGKPILRVGKIKATGATTLQSVAGHLNRSSPTPNADPARRKLNRVLVGDKSQPLEEAVLQQYAQFGIDRAKLRKDATLANDIILTVSPEWFRPDDPDAAGTWDHNRLGSFTAEAEAFLRKGFGNRL